MNTLSIRRKLAAVSLAVLGVVGTVGSSPVHAGMDPVNGPTSAPVESTDRAADRSVAPLNTAVVTSSTGNVSAQITLFRWTGSGWAREKSGNTNANGGATFRNVRGGAYYAWTTVKPSVRYDAYGNLVPCYFYTWSTDRGVWVGRGATKAIPMVGRSNTCGV
jgi:hypothetical protein